MGGSWPKPPDNPAATAHAADSFSEWEAGRSTGTESAAALISRMRIIDPTTLHRRDLRRTIHPGWALLDRGDDGNLAWLLRLLDAAISLGRRPMDRAVVATWLDVFPEGPGSEQLAAAAAMAANRHDWPYATAGQRFSLWERVSAAAALGREILANGDTDAALKSAALIVTAGIANPALPATEDSCRQHTFACHIPRSPRPCRPGLHYDRRPLCRWQSRQLPGLCGVSHRAGCGRCQDRAGGADLL